MADLDRFLRYLQRDDVDDLLFQTGKVAGLRTGAEMRPLTQKKLETSQIVTLLGTSGLSSYLPTEDTGGTAVQVTIGQADFDLAIARRGELLQVRLARPGTWTAGAAQEDRPLAAKDPPLEPPVPKQPARERVTIPREQATASTAPPAALLQLLTDARNSGASDVHISSGNEARIRRVGRLQPHGQPLNHQQVEAMLLPLLDRSRGQQLQELGYADFALSIPGIGRFRANVNRQSTGIKGCFRLIDEMPSTLDTLGLPDELRRLTDFHQGLAIVSGPSGQGKTTTMAALVDMLNTERAFHIITVEDPVEFIHPKKKSVLTQRQVGDHTNSFGSALKAALREDPDVIVIGELRDRETVEMALSAAETGHLVIATMSSPSGAKTIDRLIDMFPPDDQAQVRATLAGALKLIVSQRLVPSADKTRLYAAVSMITGGIALWSLIRDNKLFQLPSLLQRGRNFGMIRIEDSLNALLARDAITIEAAEHVADDPRVLCVPGNDSPEPLPEPSAGGLRSFFNRKG